MKKPRRVLRIVLAVLIPLIACLAILGGKIWRGFGPKLSTPSLLTARPAPEAFLFHDVALFSGSEPALKAHQDVLVRGGRIESVTATGGALPPGAEIIEGQGRTLLPGFIDAHTHLTGSGAPPWAPYRVSSEHNLQAYVYSGVTTTLVLGGLASELAGLRADAEQGRTIGPRIFYTHTPITAPGGHPLLIGKEIVPWPLSTILAALIPQPMDEKAAEHAVATIAAQKVHFVKIIRDRLPPSAPEMPEAVLKATVSAAHARGLKVFVHIGTIDDALAAARAGADVLAHGIYKGPVTAAQAEELSRRHIPLIFTMAGWVRTAALSRGQLQATALDTATVPPEILRQVCGDAGRAFGKTPALSEFVASLLENEPLWQKNLRALYEAHVPLLVGTDSPLPGIFPGSSYHAELQLLAAAGVPNAELLIAATSRAADLLGLDNGRIEAGKAADLLLVRGDPVQNLAAAEDIELIVLRGRVLLKRNHTP